MLETDYNTHSRRRFTASRSGRFKIGLKGQWALKRIGLAVMEHFDLPKPPANATIKNDLHVIEQGNMVRTDLSPEAERLLEPDNFPEWRRTMFRAPKNKDYLTPKHQLAWFHLVRTLALKEVPPQWVIDYLGLTEALHDVNLEEWVKDPEQMLTIFILAPPRHGKSDLAAHCIIWLICRDPDVRILWCAGILDISILTTSFVKRELESNEKLIELYGPFENEGSWSDKSFIVATRKTRMRAPTLHAIGKGTTILSLDADFIFGDDMFDLKASLSPTQVGKDVLWVKTQLMTRREPWTPFLGIGSHQPAPTGDAYQHMGDDHDNDIWFIKQKAHDYEKCKLLENTDQPTPMDEAARHGEWCLLWADMRSFAYLDQFRRSLGDITYEVCYNQDSSQSTLQYFRPEVVRREYPQPVTSPDTGLYLPFNYYEERSGILDYKRSFGYRVAYCCGAPTNLVACIGFDPAAGQSKGTSESALIVLQACRICERRYLVDYWHKRQSPEMHPDTIALYASTFKVNRVRIEINAYQKALSRDPRLAKAALEGKFIIDEWFTTDNKWDPSMGIPLLSRHMEQGRFSVPYALPQDKQKAEALLTQLVRYPAEPNDVVFALWLADLSVISMLDEGRIRVPRQLDPNAPQHIIDQQVTINLDALRNWE